MFKLSKDLLKINSIFRSFPIFPDVFTLWFSRKCGYFYNHVVRYDPNTLNYNYIAEEIKRKYTIFLFKVNFKTLLLLERQVFFNYVLYVFLLRQTGTYRAL